MRSANMRPGNLVQIIRAAIETGASLMFGWFRKRIQLTQAPNGQVGVNLGSAERASRGWLNLDRSAYVLVDRVPGLATVLYAARLLPKEQFDNIKSGRWRAVHFWDAHFPIPVATSSVDYIYTSHFLEHLTISKAERVLTECIRILKPGGVIRVVVPDMYRITDEYVSTMRRLDAAELADSNTTVYLSARIGVDEVSEAFAAQFYEITAERQRLFGHRWMYDKWSLRRALERAGFTEVTEMHYRHGSLPDLDELDCRPANSLHMEARKAENGTGRASTHANTHTTLLPVATIPKEH